MHMKMKFNAKALLEKHGWEKGQGLGKERQGMKEAIKVKLKPNTNGLGYSMGEQFTYNWWDHAYNEAAKKLTVSTSCDGSIKIENGDADTDLSVKKKRKKKKCPENAEINKYNYFIKSSTIVDEAIENREAGVEETFSESESLDDGHGTISSLSTQELFEACGKMTAHKGARHGVTMQGKLSRIEAQEKIFLDQLKKKQTLESGEVAELEEEGERGKKKKKKKKFIDSVKLQIEEVKEKKRKKSVENEDEYKNVEDKKKSLTDGSIGDGIKNIKKCKTIKSDVVSCIKNPSDEYDTIDKKSISEIDEVCVLGSGLKRKKKKKR